MFTSNDTITAVSSAAGSAPRAIVRLSGPDALRLADSLFVASCGRRLDEMDGFRSVDGIVSFGGIELPARAYVFRSPRSYTRQDVVELHVPGPAAVATMLQAHLVEAGARTAEAGEFTARAFFSGRIDLSAAGAVADIINAADDAQLKSAVYALNGRIFNFCKKCSDSLVEILACVEASIDLADEGIVLDTPAHQAERLRDLCDTMLSTAEQSAEIPDTAERVHVVLAGLTNVGKSSVLNAMTATSRAIVSALAGTTRDVLSASTTIGGSAVVVQDAAGFTTPTNPIDIAADTAAKRAIGHADAILMVVDITAESFQRDRELLDEIFRINRPAPLLVLANKADLVRAGDLEANIERLRQLTGLDVLATSTVTSLGLEQVKETLADMLHLSATRSGQAMGLHLRQKQCLVASAKACERAAELLRPTGELSDAAEIVAIELRQALEQLGRISGQVVNEDILTQIFHRFCVGK